MYLRYVRNLGFTETPNYEYMRSLFTSVLKKNGCECDWEFDWVIQQKVRRQQFLSIFIPWYVWYAGSCFVIRVAIISALYLLASVTVLLYVSLFKVKIIRFDCSKIFAFHFSFFVDVVNSIQAVFYILSFLWCCNVVMLMLTTVVVWHCPH